MSSEEPVFGARVADLRKQKSMTQGELATAIGRTASWLSQVEVAERMSEAYAIRLLDALDANGPHVRSHDGRDLLRAGL